MDTETSLSTSLPEFLLSIIICDQYCLSYPHDVFWKSPFLFRFWYVIRIDSGEHLLDTTIFKYLCIWAVNSSFPPTFPLNQSIVIRPHTLSVSPFALPAESLFLQKMVPKGRMVEDDCYFINICVWLGLQS